MRVVKIVLPVIGIAFVGLLIGVGIGRSSKHLGNNNQVRVIPILDEWVSEIRLDTPQENEVATNPMEFKGQIKRSWTFEAVFNAWILDSSKKIIGGGPIYTTIENETDEWVSFNTNLPYDKVGGTGYLQIKNDNPSSLPENQKIIEFPIRFE